MGVEEETRRDLLSVVEVDEVGSVEDEVEDGVEPVEAGRSVEVSAREDVHSEVIEMEDVHSEEEIEMEEEVVEVDSVEDEVEAEVDQVVDTVEVAIDHNRHHIIHCPL